MAKISLLNIFDDLVRTSDVLTAGIEKGTFDRFCTIDAVPKILALILIVFTVCRLK
jgi:hypothetical protein